MQKTKFTCQSQRDRYHIRGTVWKENEGGEHMFRGKHDEEAMSILRKEMSRGAL
jgi:hypothetical protein